MIKFQFSRLKTEIRYRILANLKHSYPKNVDEKEAIFIHIPKTAGTSIYQLIGYTGIGHVTYRWYESRNPNKFNQYFKFAFVRNPWDRLVSAFLHLKKGGNNAMDKHWATKNISSYKTFDEFVKYWLNEKNVNQYFHFVPQHRFICDTSLSLKVDYLGRFERLDQDFDFVAQKLQINRTLSRVNMSNRSHYRDYYSADTKKIIAEVYKADIELFDYHF